MMKVSMIAGWNESKCRRRTTTIWVGTNRLASLLYKSEVFLASSLTLVHQNGKHFTEILQIEQKLDN